MNELLNSEFSYVIIAVAAGLLITLVLSILCFIMVIPEKKYNSLPKFFQVLSDIFNFKSLLLEKIVKFLYLFLTFACIFIGFLMIFWFKRSYFGDIQWYGGFGIVLMILGPIVFRIFHEAVMLVILLVKNTSEINEQLKKNNSEIKKVSEKEDESSTTEEKTEETVKESDDKAENKETAENVTENADK